MEHRDHDYNGTKTHLVCLILNFDMGTGHYLKLVVRATVFRGEAPGRPSLQNLSVESPKARLLFDT